ncbi:MAG: hypothetical protein Tsb002_14280 [Wenzhouxiangellaceae bacterium]
MAVSSHKTQAVLGPKNDWPESEGSRIEFGSRDGSQRLRPAFKIKPLGQAPEGFLVTQDFQFKMSHKIGRSDFA